MPTGSWTHNFPASKDVHPAYINYPLPNWDTIIASWFHDVFTALDAMQEALGYNIIGAFADLNTRLEQLDHATKAHGLYDRGDPAAVDYIKTDLTLDGNWNDLNLSAHVPVGAIAAKIHVTVEGNSPTQEIRFRKKGNVNEINHDCVEALRPNVERCRDICAYLDSGRVTQYNADNVAWTTLSLVIRGWQIR